MENFKNLLEQELLNREFELKPTQNKISLPIVFRIFKKMKANLKFDAIRVCDNILIDGHHRYIAYVMANVTTEQFPSTKNHNQTTFEWKEVTIITTDYDYPNDIVYHNFNDAKRNGITVDEVLKMLKD